MEGFGTHYVVNCTAQKCGRRPFGYTPPRDQLADAAVSLAVRSCSREADDNLAATKPVSSSGSEQSLSELGMNPPVASSIATHNASVLLLLFADAILPPAKRGQDVPCTGNHVDVGNLASLELAWAFWTLRSRGCVVLEQYDKRECFRIFFKHSSNHRARPRR